MKDKELDSLLREFGRDMQRRTNQLAEQDFAAHRRSAVRLAVSRAHEVRQRPAFALGPWIRQLLTPQLALACVLLLTFAAAWNASIRRGHIAPLSAVKQSSSSPELGSDSSVDDETAAAYAALTAENSDTENGAAEDNAAEDSDELTTESGIFPEYSPLIVDLTAMSDTEGDSDEFDEA